MTRAEGVRDSAKRDAAATMALRGLHTGLINDAHQAGALLDSERTEIFARYATTYTTPKIDEAQQALDDAWMALWNVLKMAERQALQDQQSGA